MTVPVYDFPPIIRGDTARFGAVLKRRGLFTRAVSIQPLAAGDVVEWTITPQTGAALVFSSADGTLALNRQTGLAAFRLTAVQTQSLAADAAHRLRIRFADGDVRTWLEGKLPVRN